MFAPDTYKEQVNELIEQLFHIKRQYNESLVKINAIAQEIANGLPGIEQTLSTSLYNAYMIDIQEIIANIKEQEHSDILAQVESILNDLANYGSYL